MTSRPNSVSSMRLARSLLLVALFLGIGTYAKANVQVTVSDIPGGVRFAWTGSIVTSSLGSSGPFNNNGGIQTAPYVVFSSTTGSNGQWFQNVLSGTPIGTSPYTEYPNTLSGDFFAVHMGFNSFVMPTGYVSGASINGSVAFTGPSILSLGITPGAHVFTISGSPSTITIGTVPEPASLVIAFLALICAAVFSKRSRKSC